jgi:hypothetical protein
MPIPIPMPMTAKTITEESWPSRRSCQNLTEIWQGSQYQQCSKRAKRTEQPRNSWDLRVKGTEWAESKRFSGKHFQGIRNGNKEFQMLLKADTDLFFLWKEEIIDFEGFRWKSWIENGMDVTTMKLQFRKMSGLWRWRRFGFVEFSSALAIR